MLVLYREQTVVMRLPLGERPLEVGRDPACDVVVDDEGLADRHWLLLRQRGTVVAYDVSARARGKPQHVPFGQPMALGLRHALVREDEVAGVRYSGLARDTEALRSPVQGRAARLSLLVGRGADARVARVGDEPLHVGRDAGNDLVLMDRAVSAWHCRLEPCGDGLLLRDLGSSNGTQVNGTRVETALLQAGAHVRAGRTDMFVLERDAASATEGDSLVAQTPVMLSVLAEAEQAARLPWPALVLGESGTGKELIARLLHERGPRRGRPYVTLNAGGVPADLIESELFGHERGAFTGAHAARRGVFEQAEGGTLFLDEIGELPLGLQARLLRVLESGELRRVGAESARRVDVRLVCATHRDLRALAARGQFRADLYFRIARCVIEVPPLRARLNDVAPIAEHLLEGLRDSLGPRVLTRDALERLCGYRWPGNVRELRNVVCAAAASTQGQVIERVDIERALQRLGTQGTEVGDDALQEAVARHQGNLAAAARSLGLPRSTLRDRLRRQR